MRTALCLFVMVGFVSCDDEDDPAVELFDEDNFYEDFAATNLFGDWDLDDDNFLDEDEFTASYYEIWDLDDDGMLEESEWGTVSADFDLDDADWAIWDANGDDMIDMTEFEAGFTTYGYYDAWDGDGDGLIMDREYTDGIFDSWDFDDDGLLEESDYNTWWDRYYVI